MGPQSVYRKLLEHFGRQDWWPKSRGFRPEEWEVCLGAILTQNTSWKNVEKALDRLKEKGILGPEELLKVSVGELEEMVRPSGYYRQKAERLRILAKRVMEFGGVKEFLGKISREELLKLKGVGEETADSILLYGGGRPHFVVDLYTRRLFKRLGLGELKYREAQELVVNGIPGDEKVYREFHALIVEHSKRFCKKRPECRGCPLGRECLKNF